MGQNSSLANKPIEPDFLNQVKTTTRQACQNIRKQIGMVEMEENMIKMELKKHADDYAIMKIYARGLVVSKKEKMKMMKQIAQLQTMETNVRMALTQNSVAKVYSDLGPLFENINQQLSDPVYKNAMRQFAMNNEQLAHKMGIMDDALDDTFAVDGEENAVDDEINAVIEESLGKKLSDLHIQRVAQPQEQKAQAGVNQNIQ